MYICILHIIFCPVYLVYHIIYYTCVVLFSAGQEKSTHVGVCPKYPSFYLQDIPLLTPPYRHEIIGLIDQVTLI